ncbi:TonB-dependent receptor [Flammeovirga sp. EKP202]|uniref:TonB-dependent receptor n=1 Tax=Flammeovirga sp. EKP202 TaxID=2770592 RepID=UPI00165EE245|nr:TonB-dependent receptor [Flammeovirga sp. EKP202]MBD0403517.1 TonB-dependent receptor plug domain-containing protein [Flammeovirga sp. EKP202]
MKIHYLTCILLLFSSALSAQTIMGKIIGAKKNGISGANIVNKSTGYHSHSDQNGEFQSKDCTLGDTLQISMVGYYTRQVVLEDLNQSLTILLKEQVLSLEEVSISSKVDAHHILTDVDIQTTPVNSSQDILRKVPGIIIGQHAGGGKAEQIFLRGFDLDHGTDINITVDGMPVNMVSHAHGQGYADLHFVIPETVEKIDFGKGPYYQNRGNFTTAGYVDFRTKQRLDNSTLKVEAGQFETYRLLGMFNLMESEKQNAYVATEFLSTDGFFESPQNFNRVNLLGKYTSQPTSNDLLGVTFSYFDSKWDASGQVPQRAVDSGLISRFGAIDDTEGGATSRSNILVDHTKIIDENSSITSKVYFSKYDFELYSNFTFFLDDPVNGDQIKQKESRNIFGVSSEYNKSFTTNSFSGSWQAGITLRNDQSIDNELSHTANRKETLEYMKLGDINETNVGAYVGTFIDINKWTFNPSVRVDYFNFQYNDKLVTAYQTLSEKKAIVSPNLNVFYNATNELQLYLKSGKGFHSNDSRVVVAEQGSEILPAAYGFDLGYIWKPTPKMLLSMAYWYLYMEQEFVYVGDAGVVEPSGKTKRQGVELSYRYQPLSWLFWNVDVNYTHARAIDEPEGANYIPLAPDFTFITGLNFQFKSGIYGGINIRHINDRPANEDNSITAHGYTVTDMNLGYKMKKMSFGIQIQNLFDVEWNETQFATESRLQHETAPVEEIHFTPGNPFYLKGIIQYNF